MTKNNLIKAINHRLLVEVIFYDSAGCSLKRTAAPMDFGPRRGWKSNEQCYHFMTAGSNGNLHPLSVKESKVVEIKTLPFRFEPNDLVSWEPKWHLERDWGSCS